jgi:tripartite ATP-independent transporter DctP family solute receptor
MKNSLIKNSSKPKGGSVGRRFTRRNALKGGLALGAGLTASRFGIIGRAAAAPVTMRFGSDSPIGAPHSRSAVVLKELVESRSAGRIQVEIFPDGQLGSGGAMSNSVKTGSLDAVVVDVGNISTAVPEADVFSLPFLFKDTEQVLRFANGPVGARMKPKINEAFGCEVLGFSTDGARHLFNGKRPIRTPDDIAGLKIGVGPSRIQRDAILALGAIPTVLQINAVYTALQTGLIDGTDKSLADMIALKLFQVTKYMTVTNHFSIVGVMMVSKRFIDKLGAEDREIVRSAGQPAVDAQLEVVLKSEKSNVAFIQERGIQVFAMENPKVFSDRMQVVYKDAADRIGADIVEQARRFAESA